jgi:TolA-binding protein
VPAAAAVGIVLVAAGFWISQRRASGPDAAPSSILAVMVEASERFQVVFPRTEDLIRTPRHPYRSGALVAEDRASAELNGLAARHQAGGATRDDLYWLAAGFLSDGQLAPASDVVRYAADRYPDDAEFEIMAALVAYFDGRVEEAERRLRAVVARNPRDCVALLDLAVVLRERGKKEEAAEALKRVVELRPGTPLAERAECLAP